MARRKPKPNFIRRKGKKLFGAAKDKVLEAEKNRARSRNAKKRGTARRKNIPLSVLSEGIDLASKFAQNRRKKPATTTRRRNLDHRDAQHPIEVSKYWQGRKGYKTQWQRAHEGGQRQLFSMNSKRRVGENPVYKRAVVERRNNQTGATSRIKVVDAVGAISKHDKISVSSARTNLMSGGWVTAGNFSYKLRKTYIENPAALVLVNGAARRGRNRIGRRRKNSDDLYTGFHGHASKEDVQVFGPDGTPNDLVMLGKLDEIFYSPDGSSTAKGLTNECLEFSAMGHNRCRLASNQAGTKYFIVALKPEALPQYTPNGEFGFATRVTYQARKDHIEGDSKEHGYWHKLGEENGICPRLCTDAEGYLVFRGGDYRTEPDGIIN